MSKLRINYCGAVIDCEVIRLCSDECRYMDNVLTDSIEVNVGKVIFKIKTDVRGVDEVKYLIEDLIKKDSSVEVHICGNEKHIIFDSGEIYAGDIDFEKFEIVGETISMEHKSSKNP